MKTAKGYGERRNEILDASDMLFQTKGYERCTVNDILKEVGIAKGTFYYYFKSKEEVLDAIVTRYIDIVVNRAENILNKDNMSPVEKLMNTFMAMQIKDKVDSEMLDDLHKLENVLFHQKILNQMIIVLAPILVEIIQEGIDKRIWKCRYPLQYMQIFLAASLTLTDEGIFEIDAESQMKVMAALISMLERLLEVGEGSFMKLFMQYMA